MRREGPQEEGEGLREGRQDSMVGEVQEKEGKVQWKARFNGREGPREGGEG